MPLYEYGCPKCSQVIEAVEKFDETSDHQCSQCGVKMQRLISRSSFALKGGGWYKDGYSSAPPVKKEAKKETAAAPEKKKEAGPTKGTAS
ncbi:MAG: zinc ribbon domain-containing protein [bacterium]|nr:zinc ribbon domain-containing protein [bacterium]